MMRSALPVIALLCATAADADAPQDRFKPLASPTISPDKHRICADRISQVRAERGLPKLDRDASASEQPLLILAVDKRIDGCSLMVMAYDANDIRPVPTEAGPARLRNIQ